MASRALWRGQLRLSLVSIPVEMHSAKKSGSHISFRQIHKPSGKPIHYQKVANGVGAVDADEIVKGFEYDKDRFVLLEPEEIDAVKLESRKTLNLVQFVEACEIPPIYFDKPYYLIPTDELAEDAYRVVRDALRGKGKVGLGQLALRGREYLCAVKPCGDGLLLETLHYADEIKNADPLFASIGDEKSDDELLDVASALIEKKSAPFSAGAYEDHYRQALRELIDSKTQSKKSSKVTAEDDQGGARGGKVVDLMAALKQSLEKSEGAKTSGSAPANSAKSKRSAAKTRRGQNPTKAKAGQGTRPGKAAAKSTKKSPSNSTSKAKKPANKTSSRKKVS